MALITCKRCGHRVSTLAKECPKCGCPVSESLQQGNNSDYQDEPEPGNGFMRVLITILVLIVLGGGGYYFYDKHQKAVAEEAALAEQRRQDSIAEAKERELAEAARQDSLRKVNFSTPDLSLLELHGDVKSVDYSLFLGWSDGSSFNDKPFVFSQDGTLESTNRPYESIQRDSEGRMIHCENGVPDCCEADVHSASFEWSNEKVIVMDNLLGGSLEGNYQYTYDDNGFLSEFSYDNFQKCWKYIGKKRYTDYIVDEVGNWVQRRLKVVDAVVVCAPHGCDPGEFDPNCPSCNELTKEAREGQDKIEERTITYYTQRESKRYTLEEYLAIKDK